MFYLNIILLCSLLDLSLGFVPTKILSKRAVSKPAYAWQEASSQLISVFADPASEIEAAVGEEIYGPIFKAGIFIFASGLVSAFIAAFIVSSSDSWDDLGAEFQEGKMKQLIDDSATQAVLNQQQQKNNNDDDIVQTTVEATSSTIENIETTSVVPLDDAVNDLDL